MKRIILINFYKEKRDEKIKKYLDFFKKISLDNFKILKINEGEEIEKPDGIILSGSQKMVGDGELDEKYLSYIFSFEKPTLGICYGHQAIAKFFKAKVLKAKREHNGFEEIFLLKKSKIFEGFPEKFKMYESHKEEVIETEEFLKNFQIIAKNKEGGIEAIENKKIPIYGCQFHPEESKKEGRKYFFNFFKII